MNASASYNKCYFCVGVFLWLGMPPFDRYGVGMRGIMRIAKLSLKATTTQQPWKFPQASHLVARLTYRLGFATLSTLNHSSTPILTSTDVHSYVMLSTLCVLAAVELVLCMCITCAAQLVSCVW